jgi:hypothetical protein
MSGASPPGSRHQRGAISWVTLLLLVAAAVAGYLLWVWAPIYFDDYTVKQIVRDYMNQAVKNTDDAQLRAGMVGKIRALVQVDGVDAAGRTVRVPAIELEERDVTWERDTRGQPPMLRVSFEYSRDVVLPLLDRTTTKVFVVDLSNDLTRPDWGPAR